MRHQSSPRQGRGVSAQLTSSASPTTAAREKKNGSKSGGQSSRRTNTRVSPMLLLRGVSEAVMCQLVLTGWEQSSSVDDDKGTGGGHWGNGAS